MRVGIHTSQKAKVDKKPKDGILMIPLNMFGCMEVVDCNRSVPIGLVKH